MGGNVKTVSLVAVAVLAVAAAVWLLLDVGTGDGAGADMTGDVDASDPVALTVADTSGTAGQVVGVPATVTADESVAGRTAAAVVVDADEQGVDRFGPFVLTGGTVPLDLHVPVGDDPAEMDVRVVVCEPADEPDDGGDAGEDDDRPACVADDDLERSATVHVDVDEDDDGAPGGLQSAVSSDRLLDGSRLLADQLTVIVDVGADIGEQADQVAEQVAGGQVVAVDDTVGLAQVDFDGFNDVDELLVLADQLSESLEATVTPSGLEPEMTSDHLDAPGHAGRRRHFEHSRIEQLWYLVEDAGLDLSEQRVAVIDTGFLLDHEVFDDTLVDSSRDRLAAPLDPDRPQVASGTGSGDHGTHVAALMCADIVGAVADRRAVVGAMRTCELDAYRIPLTGDDDVGDWVDEGVILWDGIDMSQAHVVRLEIPAFEATVAAARNGASVINMSFGVSYVLADELDDDGNLQTTHRLADRADPPTVADPRALHVHTEAWDAVFSYAAHVGDDPLFVTAAGNAGAPSTMAAPSSVAALRDDLVVVGATTTGGDQLVDFSNYGPLTTVAAPGQSVMSASDTSGFGRGYKSGTSMASPLVAGTAATLRAANPQLSPGHIASCLVSAAADRGQYVSHEEPHRGRMPMLQADAAWECANDDDFDSPQLLWSDDNMDCDTEPAHLCRAWRVLSVGTAALLYGDGQLVRANVHDENERETDRAFDDGRQTQKIYGFGGTAVRVSHGSTEGSIRVGTLPDGGPRNRTATVPDGTRVEVADLDATADPTTAHAENWWWTDTFEFDEVIEFTRVGDRLVGVDRANAEVVVVSPLARRVAQHLHDSLEAAGEDTSRLVKVDLEDAGASVGPVFGDDPRSGPPQWRVFELTDKRAVLVSTIGEAFTLTVPVAREDRRREQDASMSRLGQIDNGAPPGHLAEADFPIGDIVAASFDTIVTKRFDTRWLNPEEAQDIHPGDQVILDGWTLTGDTYNHAWEYVHDSDGFSHLDIAAIDHANSNLLLGPGHHGASNFWAESLTAVDLRSGDIEWETSYAGRGNRPTVQVDADRGLVYAADESTLSALALTDGQRQWQVDLPHGPDSVRAGGSFHVDGTHLVWSQPQMLGVWRLPDL